MSSTPGLGLEQQEPDPMSHELARLLEEVLTISLEEALGYVLKFAAAMCRDGGDQERLDLTQDVFADLTKRLLAGRLQVRENVVGLLWSVTRSVYVNNYRQSTSRERIPGHKLVTLDSIPEHHAPVAASAENEALSEMDRRTLLAATETLEDEERGIVFDLYDLGKSKAQIARERGLPVSTLNDRLKAIHRKLRQEMRRNGGVE